MNTNGLQKRLWRVYIPVIVFIFIGFFVYANLPIRLPREMIATIRNNKQLQLIEGLPHPGFNSEQFKRERDLKSVQKIEGDYFYTEILQLSPTDAEAIALLLSSESTYQPYVKGKRCGGFHSDYAIEWNGNEKTYRALICFGCGEIKLVGPDGTSHYDLVNEREEQLKSLLKKYRKNRPMPPKFMDDVSW